MTIRLGINVDHVATVRNARGGAHPDPVRAAKAALAAGADSITAHLREDRRHIRDADIEALRLLPAPLNFEMAATPEMVAIASRLKPHACCLVPERRAERTTEGGLDLIGQKEALAPAIATLKAAGIRVSLFIEPTAAVIAAAAELGAPVIELHTGTWCHALADQDAAKSAAEFERIKAAASQGASLGLEIHAGHGLDYASAEQISALPEIAELNIGHFLIGEAVFVGLGNTIARMRQAMERGRGMRGAAA
ncbi:pyridoxine 5'-phosphate synthase [Terrihabitans soli]|uniref:Pyridoxine 5'-phosphate synthase n=1 Tax=Terrihabitans soli TaxID=708113 RepID=A0A6S6QT86_9HYPH|nr:pyridoxine 5'-phosphate synthase [Terrihabitans soli]BCJ90482.1 pyridoxine 5'-phosphate synthase [Terrihabitans soli]